ncbi:hypothetical protein HNR42_002155 [Deinobacterium chartae]|uniref:DUF4097 domain-containing protein n=1 Tax=Deinobacterium chartae TaxID=521158 RepID=A0A841I2T3_9DEIO|nr:DUF4097 family beta strand repeat-containing protein [Deinobacterium chartae]MBB6098720.1 hypothetical protein [Deinobacterium chartae]
MTQEPSFEQRVRELVNEGKLTPEEAEQLLGTRRDIIPVEPTQAGSNVSIKLISGDITVRGSEDIQQPRVLRGGEDIELIPTHDGWRVHQRPDREEGSLFERILQGLNRLRSIKVELEIPRRTPHLEVNAVVGDVDIEQVSGFVTAKLQAGDLTLRGVGGFDVSAKAGDIDIYAHVTEGRHRVDAVAGDVDLRLSPSSSAKVTVDMAAGDVTGHDFAIAKRSGGVVGGRYDGVLGAGTADITLNLTAGDVKVRLDPNIQPVRGAAAPAAPTAPTAPAAPVAPTAPAQPSFERASDEGVRFEKKEL